MEKLCITIYVLFYNNNSKKYSESEKNRGAMVSLFLSDWKFFSVKVLKIQKIIWN